MLLKRKTVILAKLESFSASTDAYGTTTSPGIPNNTINTAPVALNIIDPVITPCAGETKELDIIRPWLGGGIKAQTTNYVDVSFKMPISGGIFSGSKTPNANSILSICGFSSTNTANTTDFIRVTSADALINATKIKLNSVRDLNVGDIVKSSVSGAIPNGTVIKQINRVTSTITLGNIEAEDVKITKAIPSGSIITIGAGILQRVVIKDSDSSTELRVNSPQYIKKGMNIGIQSDGSDQIAAVEEFTTSQMTATLKSNVAVNLNQLTVNENLDSFIKSGGVLIPGITVSSPDFPIPNNTVINEYNSGSKLITLSSGISASATAGEKILLTKYPITTKTNDLKVSPITLTSHTGFSWGTASLTLTSAAPVDSIEGFTLAKNMSGVNLPVYNTYVKTHTGDSSNLVVNSYYNGAPALTASSILAFVDIPVHLTSAASFNENSNVYFSTQVYKYIADSTDIMYGTLAVIIDNNKHILTGVRGNVKMIFNTGDFPVFDFSLKGLYNNPTSEPFINPIFTQYPNPLPVNKENTKIVYCGKELNTSKCEIDLGNTVEYRQFTQLENVIITDRKITGTISWEAPSILSYDYFTHVKENQSGDLVIVHGVVGNKVSITVKNVILSDLKYEDDNGVYLFTATISVFVNNPTDALSMSLF